MVSIFFFLTLIPISCLSPITYICSTFHKLLSTFYPNLKMPYTFCSIFHMLSQPLISGQILSTQHHFVLKPHCSSPIIPSVIFLTCSIGVFPYTFLQYYKLMLLQFLHSPLYNSTITPVTLNHLPCIFIQTCHFPIF